MSDRRLPRGAGARRSRTVSAMTARASTKRRASADRPSMVLHPFRKISVRCPWAGKAVTRPWRGSQGRVDHGLLLDGRGWFHLSRCADEHTRPKGRGRSRPSDEVAPPRRRDRLASARAPQFAQDRRDVRADGVDRAALVVRDGLVAQAAGHRPKHVQLDRRESVGLGRALPRAPHAGRPLRRNARSPPRRPGASRAAPPPSAPARGLAAR